MESNTTFCPPDLSARPHSLVVSQKMNLAPAQVYDAWCKHFDHWFAQPGTLIMKPEVNSLFYFETFFENQRHPHYGRFLNLVENELVEMTWITELGTQGAETVVRVEIEREADGVNVVLRHSGLPTEKAKVGHEGPWKYILGEFEQLMKTKNS